MKVWVVVSEPDESHGDYGYPVEVYTSREGADQAVDRWWKEHREEEEDQRGWCECHGESVSVHGPFEVQSPRHLHEGGEWTLCGKEFIPTHRDRPGLPVERARTRTGEPVVHVTKARKSDCGSCRAAFRAQVRDRSGKEYRTQEEKEREG